MRLSDLTRRFTENEYVSVPTSSNVRAASNLSNAAGSDGESWFNDLYAGGPDINPELSGRAKYEVYREMASSDPAIRSVEWMYGLTVREAAWIIDPASEDPVDRVIADYVEDNLGLGDEIGWMDLTWSESLTQALQFLRWGSMGEELIFSKDVRVWNDADGDPHIVRPLARLAPRSPASVSTLKVNASTGLIDFIEQDVSRESRPIPGDKLVWYCLDREGNNFFGTSLLRPMYGPWRLKTAMMICAGVGWDRFAAGTPLVRHPAGKDNQKLAREIATNYRLYERGYVTMEQSPDWSFEIVNGAATLADPVPLLRHFDQQIALAGLQTFSQLGVTETGSRAVGEVLSEPFYRAASAIADQIATSRTRWVLRRMVDVNFGAQYDVPRLRVSKIVPQDITALSLALSNLSSGGFVFTDRSVQDDLRDRLGLSALPDLDEPTATRIAEALATLPEGVGVTSVNGAKRLDAVA